MMSKSIRLLIVDDDDVDRERVCRMLKKVDFDAEVFEASSVEEALLALKQSTFHCIVVDYRLGIDSGIDFLEKIRLDDTQFCAIIMITGLGDEDVAAAAMRAGAFDYITKNQLSASRLVRAILGALHRSDLERRLHEMAYYDALTRLASRTLFMDRLQQVVARKDRDNKISAVVYIDLDNFKPINDTYGHAAGDFVLIEIANRLKQSVRTSDTVARLGGDEFALILHELTSVQDCEHVLQYLSGAVTLPISLPDDDRNIVRVTASIGVTLIHDNSMEADTVLRQADQTMYSVKNSGRNDIMFFDEAAEQQLISTRKHLELVEQGISNDEFILYYQPKIHLKTRQIVGLEALLRWQHPTLGVLIPENFQQSLEHKYLGITIGNWVLQQALSQMSYWCSLDHNIKVSVNISAHHLQHKDFIPQLEEMLNNAKNVSPHLLELEILESVAISDFSNVAKVIDECHALGVSIALDDFGTGYSSLTYLRQLSLDTLKIDKSFVINMLSDNNDCAIVASVIGLSKNFNRHVIAEGVESASHIHKLMEMGCDCGQGYGIAYPMPSAEVLAWINSNTSNSNTFYFLNHSFKH